MLKFDDTFGFRPNWVFDPNRGTNQTHLQPKSADEPNFGDSIEDKRENHSSEDKSGYRRVNKKSCPVQPFADTLKLIEFLFPHKI